MSNTPPPSPKLSAIYLILSTPRSIINHSYPLEFAPSYIGPLGLSSKDTEKWITQQTEHLSKPWYKIYSASSLTPSFSKPTSRKVLLSPVSGLVSGSGSLPTSALAPASVSETAVVERHIFTSTHTVPDIYGGGAGNMHVLIETSADVNVQPQIKMYGWSRDADAAQRRVAQVQSHMDRKGRAKREGTCVFVEVVPLM
jgi:hypothetical protein